MTEFIGLQAIRQRKIEIARWAMSEFKPKVVLKTDAYNERIKMPIVQEFKDAERVYIADKESGTLIKAIKYLRQPNVMAMNTDIINIPLCKETVDLVYESGTVNFFKDLSNVPMAIREFYRILKPNGILITTPFLGDITKNCDHKGWEEIQWLNAPFFFKWLDPYFEHIKDGIISASPDDNAYLHYFVARKRTENTEH